MNDIKKRVKVLAWPDKENCFLVISGPLQQKRNYGEKWYTGNQEHIRKYDRMDIVIKFMQAKKEHPDYNKNQLCALIGVSDSYLKRVMKDLDIKSFYRHDIPVNK